jgi:hypothetical protein
MTMRDRLRQAYSWFVHCTLSGENPPYARTILLSDPTGLSLFILTVAGNGPPSELTEQSQTNTNGLHF